MSIDIKSLTINELTGFLEKMSEKDKESVIQQYRDYLLGEEFKTKLKSTNGDALLSLILALPEKLFVDFISAHEDVIAEKLSEVSAGSVAKIFEMLPVHLRKEFNRRFRTHLEQRIRKMTLDEILKMIYNVSPPNRSSLLSPIKPYLMSLEFSKIILDIELEKFEEFLSVLPEDIRTSLIKRHKGTILSEEFKEKIRNSSNEAIVNVLRWFPDNIYKEFIDKFKDVLEEKGLKLA
ncbi:MAG: hypothetical protein ACTSX9_03315 [Candidatus Njordarchaeales archaeon]